MTVLTYTSYSLSSVTTGVPKTELDGFSNSTVVDSTLVRHLPCRRPSFLVLKAEYLMCYVELYMLYMFYMVCRVVYNSTNNL